MSYFFLYLHSTSKFNVNIMKNVFLIFIFYLLFFSYAYNLPRVYVSMVTIVKSEHLGRIEFMIKYFVNSKVSVILQGYAIDLIKSI